MPNPVLDRLLEQRDAQISFVAGTLERVDAEQRDLVDAEQRNLEAAKQRIAELDAQIKPLEEFEKIRSAHTGSAKVVPSQVPEQGEQRSTGERRSLGVQTRAREVVYPDAGHFLVDLVRSMDFQDRAGDADARDRVMAARAAGDVAAGSHQTTDDTPGLMPRNIMGQILNDIDAARPFVSSIGVKDLAGIPGKNFDRPVLTQHTKAGKQTAEKAEGESGEVKIGTVAFSKETFLTWMNVSRQEIDWTSPTAWNILIADMMDAYAISTEDAAAAKFAGLVTLTQAMASNDVTGYIKAMYAARTKIVTGGAGLAGRPSTRRLPDMVWLSLDMDDAIGELIDTQLATSNADQAAGTGDNLTRFGGQLMKLPRVMVPGLPAGTMILGKSDRTEFYEDRVGFLQAVEPKVLGVQIAYGGYTASGNVDSSSFCKITKAAG